MAKRRRKSSGSIVRYSAPRFSVPRAPAPIIKVSAPRAAPMAKHKRRRGGRRHGGGGGDTRWDLVMGAAALGFAAKQGLLARVPTFFGMGPITNFGLVTWGIGKWGGIKLPEIVKDAGLAARIISGFEFGRGGTLVGAGNGAPAGGAAVFY